MTTYHTKFINGAPVGVPNQVDPSIGYYVSYNNYDIRIYGCPTTAIVIDKTSAFLILNGDHRAALKGMSLTQACEYFHNNLHLKNKLSDDHQDNVLREVDGIWKTVRLN